MRLMRNSLCGMAAPAVFSAALLLFVSSPRGVFCADLDGARPGGGDRKEGDEAGEEEFEPILEGDAHEKFHHNLAEEGKKNLEEIQRLLDEVQKGLAQKETGSGTQAKQKQVVERLEKLIKELDKSCSSCSSSSSSSDKKQQQSSARKKQSASEKQKAEDEKEGKKKDSRENQKLQANQQKPEQKKDKDSDSGKVENDRTEDGPPPDGKAGQLADQIREARRWGILPPKIAEAMLFSSGKEAPHEYKEIISRYYKRLNEIQSRSR
ncbi:MAG TPA: hypothetical protein VMT52_08085 [Planctomycetota bacterium]|nr:hypothetical protein [Planctomycetota bacterium]